VLLAAVLAVEGWEVQQAVEEDPPQQATAAAAQAVADHEQEVEEDFQLLEKVLAEHLEVLGVLVLLLHSWCQ
jgi:hypothetical protein